MPDTQLTRAVGSEREHALAVAARTWRRIGVRADERRRLHDELGAELAGAQADGLPLTAVLGEDAADMARRWAEERGLAWRALWLGRLVPVALAGVVGGFAVTLVSLGMDFTAYGTGHGNTHGALVLAMYTTSPVTAVLLASWGCWAVLRVSGDPHAARTARWVAGLLPAGGAVATAAGVVTASLSGFSIERETFVSVVAVVLLVLAATLAVARLLAVRPVRGGN
ncbi:hypothetical protein OF117_15090 [Geodermatophilus sp. YIM 151500]|uniref:hypothetical protein n=1 Tax=Geodermatophilus sp. YIM 151500 TaxID=2984531 RepID=UPI0021E4E6FC|nr:hypothetical protein [Geodermatophilus sp. YIM 151500]MCV2490684.1 hypothetical protein [Geodermatophilus sp. YIM 151500]